jgi:hypothetical protein
MRPAIKVIPATRMAMHTANPNKSKISPPNRLLEVRRSNVRQGVNKYRVTWESKRGGIEKYLPTRKPAPAIRKIGRILFRNKVNKLDQISLAFVDW